MITFSKALKVKKGWGQELVIANNANYCGKVLCYDKGESLSSGHFHLNKSETFYVVQGSFLFYWWDEKGIKCDRVIEQGDVIDIPKGCPHQLFCLKDKSAIFEVSTPHSDEDVVRIEPGDSQTKTEKKRTSKVKSVCPECLGDGRVQDGGMFSPYFKCDVCNGKGFVFLKK